MTGARLAVRIPSASTPIPAGWWKTALLPAIDATTDLDEVREKKLQADALAKYVKDRKQRMELNKAGIVAAMRIGELAGPPPGKTGRGKVTTRGDISQQDHIRFWSLARHRKLVLKLLDQDIDSMRRVLWRLRNGHRPSEQLTGIEVREGDFRHVLADLSGMVDAIITDPPYAKQYLTMYWDLSGVAAEILRPGGICAVMVGQSYLPEVIGALADRLSYRWTLAYLTGGSAAAIHGRRVQTYWKPVLIYEKPPANPSHRIGGDVIRSEGGDTDPTHHGWGQNESGMLALIQRLTERSDLIVDPFLGGGTTLVAAARAGRSAIGCDIDPKAVATARARLA